MRKVNFDAIKEHVSTHYGDLTGVIQIDGHSNISSIYELCKDYLFDTTDKFIIGFGLSESTTDGIGRKGKATCSILYVGKKEYGNNFDEIEAKIKSVGTFRVMKKVFYVDYNELGKYIKRYDFIATNELTKYVTTIEIDDDESEE